MTAFERFVGIDYSGAETAESPLKGIRVYLAGREGEPEEVPPPREAGRAWSRMAVATWLEAVLAEGPLTLVGLDHAFSFPLAYFERYRLPPDWDRFLTDFHAHWPTDEPDGYVDFVREGIRGLGRKRTGDTRWRRLTEEWAGGAKSVFHFDVPGSVAKSTHAGLPWLRRLRRALGGRIHCWPFDGWEPPAGKSVLAEVYPSRWKKLFPAEGRTADQQDAYGVARRLQVAQQSGELAEWFKPALPEEVRTIAATEGWILGVVEPVKRKSSRRAAPGRSRTPRQKQEEEIDSAWKLALVARAVAFAAEKHRDHRRKNAGRTPYFNHLAEVAEILVTAGAVRDPELLAAAYLHDTVEDTDTTREELEAAFGRRVADLVAEVSDDKSLPKARRKELQVEHAAHASPPVVLLKTADKIANLRSLLVDPPPDWDAERVAAYFAWARRVVEALPAQHLGLRAEFERVQEAFEKRRP